MSIYISSGMYHITGGDIRGLVDSHIYLLQEDLDVQRRRDVRANAAVSTS